MIDDADRDPTAVARHIERDARAHRDREVARALQRLEVRGVVTTPQRATIESLADSLLDGLIAVPLETIESTRDPETLANAMELFDPND